MIKDKIKNDSKVKRSFMINKDNIKSLEVIKEREGKNYGDIVNDALQYYLKNKLQEQV